MLLGQLFGVDLNIQLQDGINYKKQQTFTFKHLNRVLVCVWGMHHHEQY